MSDVENSLGLIGYRVRHRKSQAFDLTGFTKIVQSGGEQYCAVRTDGRWEVLRGIGEGGNTIYGIASHDRLCPKDHYRYTVAIEGSAEQFGRVPPYDDLFSVHIAESEWVVFELESFGKQYGKFWQDDPYAMLQELGWGFDMSIGIHIDVYAPSYTKDDDGMEFWMPVKTRAQGA